MGFTVGLNRWGGFEFTEGLVKIKSNEKEHIINFLKDSIECTALTYYDIEETKDEITAFAGIGSMRNLVELIKEYGLSLSIHTENLTSVDAYKLGKINNKSIIIDLGIKDKRNLFSILNKTTEKDVRLILTNTLVNYLDLYMSRMRVEGETYYHPPYGNIEITKKINLGVFKM